MFQNIIIGQYVPGNSVLHRLDPRAKLVAVFLLVLFVFFANDWISYGVLVTFTLTVILLSRVPLSFIYRGLRPILWLVLLTVLLHLLMTKEGAVVFTIGGFTVHEQGIINGVFLSIRLLTLVILTSLLTLTTTPIQVTDGLETLLSPLKRIGVPAHEIALMISIALRFIPTFMQETEKIMKAQMARGVDLTTGPIKERLNALLPLLIPLFMSAFKRAEDLALAMEARGYRGGEGRTKLRALTWKSRDTWLLIVVCAFGVGLFLLRA
ncbi:energy-coupling factor transporter transmembrane protein EcfT [Halalkalibacterium halodurans]|jgi:energy-coupling factor transport system permease protein|uniref:Energy-coupling factor transporter transmembrane protein EcfT n=2 Tax=Halalkalibacterium halodurans TaxID=86665 RepID=Q7AK00_HALH5|nr:energy-coupling factor transporter transmembrane protein EcfT [Halalkalibacterium halodurans]MDY7220666.1 energy-coupling factor transporter transmembrane protein EcfT [Halalkalibacterium halodurans]MDY7239905.1 energy-coupling factor transporter transmembrane protein EcfT [Halalkalibacterium halodurans]MED4081270.1 energy-coupling factor transporter transmembrane protein EcfT [Halalkalibacterium halodurans]MED4083985.1 energy-coupling factor transporter transmembrane protein EcfT [Halalkali